jgi:hypothetical protein
MKKVLFVGLFCACALAASAAPSTDPYIAYAFPAGGQSGTTFRILVAGQSLKGSDTVLISGKGARASVISYTGSGGPLSSLQEEELKRKLEELIRAKMTPAKTFVPAAATATLPDIAELQNLEARSIAELRAIGEKYLNRTQRPKAPMNEIVEIEVSIDPEARPGRRELRVLAAGGVSNPVAFLVGNIPEYVEPDRFVTGPKADTGPNSAPFVMNGQIFPGEADNFQVALEKGETIDCSVQARSLIPYLADAVPGWFQAVLAVYGPEGKELAYSDDFGSDPDPRLKFTAASAGTYTLQVRDSIYRGRFDFVYRLEVRKAQAVSRQNQIAAGFKGGIDGCISFAGEKDIYPIEGKAGETIVAEIRARRDGSPLDSSLTLTDASGKTLAFNDDFEDKEAGLLTHQADSYLRHTFAQSGAYTLTVADVNHAGSPGHFYSLRLGPPTEDFALLIDKSAINIPITGSAVFSVLAVRKDGWDGDIEIVAKNAPPGLSIEGGLIPRGRESSRMTVTFRAISPSAPYELELEGRALVRGVQVTRPVKPADRMMQAFANLHYVPAQSIYLGFARGKIKFASIAYYPSGNLIIPAGGTAEIAVEVRPLPGPAMSRVNLELVDPPAGIQLKESRLTETGFSILISADAKLAGKKETLIIRATVDLPGSPSKTAEIGLLPALGIEVSTK